MTYRWLNDASQKFLERDYLLPGQTVDERVNQIVDRAQEILGIEDFAKHFKENLQKGWYSLSSPIWTNFATDRGLPISCFGTNIDDSMESILKAHSEIGIMSKFGGGTSAFFGKVRERGAPIKEGRNGESSGAVHFMQLFDQAINVISQGSSRRGQCAAYLPIDHPDFDEFMTIRTEASTIQSLSTGVCVSDDFMERMMNRDPEAGRRWAKVLSSRSETGYPYIFFEDNANNFTPYVDTHYRINHSNLCSEIMLPNSDDESFVCDLSSMNVRYYDEWKNTNAVELLTFFLDAVMTEFIEKADGVWGMERPVKFAKRHRALGIGWLGWHSYLQSKMIPFESIQARGLNQEIGQFIQDRALHASRFLAAMFGPCEALKEYGVDDVRNTTLTAIAPTKSSSFIIGQASECVEPIRSNYYIRDVQKGKFTIKNPKLMEVLEEHGRNDDATWRSILEHGGSVQQLDFLTDHEKNVFKTFAEISPAEIIAQAAQRQRFVDQGQSVNLIIHPSVPVKDVNQLLIDAWKSGIKSLYYQMSVNAAQEFVRDINRCVLCEA